VKRLESCQRQRQTMRINKNELIAACLAFFVISVFVVSGIIFNDQLIGRYLDSSVPPVDYLVNNNYLMNFYQWWGTINGGIRNGFGAALIPGNSILYFPVVFGAGAWFIPRYQILLTLFSAMASFYLLARRLIEDYSLNDKGKIILSFLGSLFFSLNNYLFSDIIFGSNAQHFTFALSPLLAYSAISYLKINENRFFFLALAALLVMSSTLQHFVFAYTILVIISVIYSNYKFIFSLASAHGVLSLYWILPLLYSAPAIASKEMAVDYSAGLIGSSSPLASGLINSEYFANRNLYNLAINSFWLSSLWILNAFVLLVASLVSLFNIKWYKEKKDVSLIFSCSLMFLISIVLNKGGREPFGGIVLFLYSHFTALSLFRSLQHYLSFYTLSISILFVFSGVFLIRKNIKFIYLLSFLVIINAMPWWYTLDIGAKNIPLANTVPSYLSEFYLTKGNAEMYALNKLPLDFSILHIPPGHSIYFAAVGKNEFNYIVRPGGKMKSQGGDNGLFYGNKRFYASDASSNLLTSALDDMEQNIYEDDEFLESNKNMFSILNLRYLVVRDDVRPLFSKNSGLFNLRNIKKSINRSSMFSSIKKEDYITIAKLVDFLPHFYTASKVRVTSNDVKALPAMVNNPGYEIGSVIYFSRQNENKINMFPESENENMPEADPPVIEFKKIDSTKYRVNVHGATAAIHLVFTDSFNAGWQAYLVGNNKSEDLRQKRGDVVENYKMLDGDEKDQATKNEVKDFIARGWITALGDGKEKRDYTEKYNIDYISKNFRNTIQNDNLASGHFWETWLRNPIPEKNHLTANGYANSWIIDTHRICEENMDACVQNSDGTCDLSLIVEFWPQRLFYFGLLLSGAALSAFLIYFLYSSRLSRAGYET